MFQVGDPHFAQLLYRLKEGNQTKKDIEGIKAMKYTNMSTWPEDDVRLITNNLKNRQHYID